MNHEPGASSRQTGGVALREEGCLVLGDLAQVFATLNHHRCHRTETVAYVDFVRTQRRGALRLLTQIDAVAVGIGGSSHAVHGDKHFLMRVLTVLYFVEGTGHIVDDFDRK